MNKSAFTESLSLLWNRRFGTFWVASLLSNIGTWAQQVAQPWLLLSMGASSFLVGLDNFAMNAPVWLLTLVGGILADHADRRRVIARFQSIQMLCPILIVVLLLTGTVQPWMIIVLSLVVGITDALSMPSFQSIVPSIVEPKQISSALALNSTQFNLSRILGPAFAGILIASIGAVGCFALSAASYVPFILIALWILPRRSPIPYTNAFDGRGIIAGAREIGRDPDLRGALLTVLITSSLCGPIITFCPVLVLDALHGDAVGFSMTLGAFGIGGLLGALVLMSISPKHDRRRLSLWFAICYGVIVVLAALNPWFWGLPALLVLAGAVMNISNTSANSLLQSTAPQRLLGQAVGLQMLAIRGGISLGSLFTGISVGLLGVRHALLINGLLAVVAQLVAGRIWLRSRLRESSLELEAKQ